MSEYKHGEGLPPVGWHGEVTWGKKATWHECVICPRCVAYKNSAGRWVTDELSTLGGFEFRPLSSERERWVEQALNVLQKDPCAMPAQLMGMIYDALKSGDLKAPD